MIRALKEARKGLGKVNPNPMVGAVVVKKGNLISTGYHKKAGGAHAETIALRKADKDAKGADLYITLEPCHHLGKTPPCTQQILNSGIKRVFVAIKDPNPLVHGKGIAFLKQHGVEVHLGILKNEARKINEVFFTFIKTGKPFIISKTAISLDGKIATKSGDSKWITNQKTREFVHLLRASVDAIVVGKNTALLDNPKLTARKHGIMIKNPYRIIFDATLSLPLSLSLFKNNSDRKTIVVTSKNPPKQKLKNLENLNVQILQFPTTNKKISLDACLLALGKQNITSILIEGGGNLITQFLQQQLIDKMYYCIAPILIGNDGIPCVDTLKLDRINNSFALQYVSIKTLDDNVVFCGYR